jgi:hypothetical protein
LEDTSEDVWRGSIKRDFKPLLVRDKCQTLGKSSRVRQSVSDVPWLESVFERAEKAVPPRTGAENAVIPII